MAEKTTGAEFAKKLMKALGKEKPRPQRKVRIMDEILTLEAVTYEEVEGIEKSADGEFEQLKAMVYHGCPEIREAAGEMMRLGAIHSPIQIMDSFFVSDLTKMAEIVASLSREYYQPSVEELDALKN